MQIGIYHTLKVLRQTSVGLFLGNEKGEDILLPKKFVKPDFKIGDMVNVFVYLDSDERPTATTQTPDILLNEFAFLEVGLVNKVGAFLIWGIDKQLLVPFSEQKSKMQEGDFHLVYMFEDEQTHRLTASAKWEKFVSKDTSQLKEHQEVDVMILGETELGINCIVNNKYKGLAFANENFKHVETGDKMKAYIKKVREDGKLDLLFEKPGAEAMDAQAEKVLKILRKNGGFLPFHDKSDADQIQHAMQMSKKAYKKAIGNLYKQRLIFLQEDGIQLIDK